MNFFSSHGEKSKKNETYTSCLAFTDHINEKVTQKPQTLYAIQQKNRFYRSNKQRKSLSKNISLFEHQQKGQETLGLTNALKNRQQNSLQGLLKTRQSYLRKLKFQQYYLSSEKICSQNLQNEGQQNKKSGAQVEVSTLSKDQNSYSVIINNQWFIKKRVLPIKLRAKSHTSFLRQPLGEKNFSNQQNCKVQAEQCHKNALKFMPLLGKNKNLNSTLMRNKKCIRESKNDNIKCPQQKQVSLHEEKLVNNGGRWNEEQKKNACTTHTRKKTIVGKILKKAVNSSFQDNFKLSPWQNKGLKEDKQNEGLL